MTELEKQARIEGVLIGLRIARDIVKEMGTRPEKEAILRRLKEAAGEEVL